MRSELKKSGASSSNMLSARIVELNKDYVGRESDLSSSRGKISESLGKLHRYANMEISGISEKLYESRGFFAKLADKLFGRKHGVPVVSEKQTVGDVSLAGKARTAVEANSLNDHNSQEISSVFVAGKINEKTALSNNDSNMINNGNESKTKVELTEK